MVQKNIILLLGETAAGKTEHIIVNAKEFEIINCDSRQIYKYLDIGTAKPPKQILKSIKHHFIDIKEISEHFSGGEFFRLTKKILNEDKDFIISAGTPFYINIIINGIDKIPQIRQETRNRINLIVKERGLQFLYNELVKIDPFRAEQLSPNDTQRIKRAMEVFYETNQPITSFYNKKEKLNIDFKRIIYIKKDKDELKKRITQRTENMLKNGLIEEVRNLIEKYSEKTLYNKRIIGYNETINFLNNRINKSELINNIIHNTMLYVKRQRTFFKKILKPFENKVEIIE